MKPPQPHAQKDAVADDYNYILNGIMGGFNLSAMLCSTSQGICGKFYSFCTMNCNNSCVIAINSCVQYACAPQIKMTVLIPEKNIATSGLAYAGTY